MTGRIAGDSLFLARYGTRALALMYLVTAVVLAVIAITFAQYARRTALNRLLIWSCSALAIFGLLLRLLLYASWPGSAIAAYIWADTTVAGTAILFWSLFGQVFDIHEGKQAIGIVGAAATLGCIFTGFLVHPFVKAFGTSNLLFVVSFLVLAMAALVLGLILSGTQLRGIQQSSGNSVSPGLGYYLELLRGARVRTLAAHTSVAAFVIILVEFQFKAAVQARFSGPALAGFFGTFYAVANIVGLLLQLLVVRQLLQGRRLATSLQFLPGSFAISGIAILAVGPWAVIAARFVGQILQYGVDAAGLQLVYLGIRKQTRPQVRALADGICRPLAVAAAAGTLAVASRFLPPGALAVLTTLMSISWLLLARQNYQLYVNDLLVAVNARSLDFSGEYQYLRDSALEEQLRKQLLSATGEDLEYVVSVVAVIQTVDWSPEMSQLLERPEVEFKLHALSYLARRPENADHNSIRPYLEHPDARVRRAAVSAISHDADHVAAVAALISDPDPHVRATAAASATREGSAEMQSVAIKAIFEMVSDSAVETRVALANAASLLPTEVASRVLKQLLADSDIRVRCAALDAAGTCANSMLLPLILEALFDRSTSDSATGALMNSGNQLAAHLDALEDRELAFLLGRSDRLPVVLTTVGDEQCFLILERAVLTAGKGASSVLIQSYCRLALRQASIQSSSFASALHVQLDAANLWRVAGGRIHESSGNEFLKRAMVEEFERHIDNAFRFVTARYPDAGLEGIRSHLRNRRTGLRSEAIELLEHVLPTALSREFSTLLEPERTSKTDIGKEMIQFANADTPESVLLGVLEAFAQTEEEIPSGARDQLLRHSSGLVRQTTLYYFTRTCPDRETVSKECERMSHDQNQEVARFAASVVSAGGVGPPRIGGMMTVIEKILTLGRIPIFSELDTTALAHVSSCATEETFHAGAKIIVEGEYGEHMFIIVDGSVEIASGGVHLQNLSSMDFFGEMSMLDGGARSASVFALTDCLLLRIGKEDFEQLLSAYSSAALAVIRTLSKRLRDGVSLATHA